MFEKNKIEAAILELSARLRAEKKISNLDLLEICQKQGIRLVSEANDTHLAHEILEVAVNHYIAGNYCLKAVGDSAEDSKTLDRLKNLESRIPTESWRSSDQQRLQQYSTPPALAFLMAKILSPSKDEFALEPSAGTGSLTTWLKMAGCCPLHLNELSARRRDLLELQGYSPTGINAEFLDDLLPQEIMPDAVLMNPPFSSSGGRTKTNDSNFGFRHVRAALSRLKPGGRLVALLGTGALTETDKGRRFLGEIASNNDLSAVINLPKDAFYKYGTSLQTSILCLRKDDPKTLAKPKNDFVINCRSLEEALSLAGVLTEKA